MLTGKHPGTPLLLSNTLHSTDTGKSLLFLSLLTYFLSLPVVIFHHSNKATLFLSQIAFCTTSFAFNRSCPIPKTKLFQSLQYQLILSLFCPLLQPHFFLLFSFLSIFAIFKSDFNFLQFSSHYWWQFFSFSILCYFSVFCFRSCDFLLCFFREPTLLAIHLFRASIVFYRSRI